MLELVCPAGTPASLRAAVESGADAVYCGLRDATNARNFPGLNFSPDELAASVEFAHARGAKVLLAINTFATAGDTAPWMRAVDTAAACGVDAIVVADLAVLDHAVSRHPDLRLHLSVQAAAGTPEAIDFYAGRFGVKRVVLPRILSIPEIRKLADEIDVEIEAFAFGGLCVMTEGRCDLSSYVTGRSPNLSGVCSPSECVSYSGENGQRSAKLSGLTVNRSPAGEPVGYPTLCKGRFVDGGEASHIFEDPVSLNTIDVLPDLVAAGVSALKIEGRQRGKAYVQQVTREFRTAIDAALAGGPAGQGGTLSALTEGHRSTTGAYRKTWR
jgi:collagenase-like PrtC family protease